MSPTCHTGASPHASHVGVGDTSGESQGLMGVAWNLGTQELNVCQGKIEA